MNYRQATYEDLEQFLDNRMEFSATVKEIPNLEAYRESTENYLREHMEKDDLLIYLAVEDGRIVSSCMACIITTAPLPSRLSGKSAELLNVYTVREYRRQGHAAALLNMLFKELKRRGVPKVVLEYTDAGLPLYKELGFSELERQMFLRLR